MDKEQRKRSAYRTIIEDRGEGGEAEVYFTVLVSGTAAALHRQQEMPWDNESGTGNDEDVQMWDMSLGTLKKLIEQTQICIQQSEAFEKARPKVSEKEQGQ